MLEKPIKGSQLTPNNVQEECVRVQKVYDWVVDAVSRDDRITVPEECQAAIDLAVEEGRIPLDVTCEAPEVPPLFPLIPKPQPDPSGDAFCVISANIERPKTVYVDGVPVEVAVIKAVFRVLPTVTVRDSNGDIICEFMPAITQSKKIAVCLPEPLTRDNILCRITQITCDENFLEDAPGGELDLQLDVTICFEIQVEAEVKLEIWAKFCHPRENDIRVKDRVVCPEFRFPEQCPDLFPRQNCDCQAWAMTMQDNQMVTLTGTAGSVSPMPNMTTLHANICNNCTLAGSTLRYTFKDLQDTGANDVDYSFTFKAKSFDQPECDDTDPTAPVMTITGQGWLKFDDETNNLLNRRVNYTLEIQNGEYMLTLTDVAGNTAVATGTSVPADELIVEDCVTFQDLD
ncbi:hypothetical protein LC065_13290 [Halobacillus litoralis]|uniref:hypothetical protein n=1 Tax=Halobacillus litoralis TaxID=45668 RepID=UPI001CFEBFA6|nr:hypothetical protein [Halobacillus litoralis]WLR46542.1 hypothetical protein LC065_13290 [Halobacillus litoralis]